MRILDRFTQHFEKKDGYHLVKCEPALYDKLVDEAIDAGRLAVGEKGEYLISFPQMDVEIIRC